MNTKNGKSVHQSVELLMVDCKCEEGMNGHVDFFNWIIHQDLCKVAEDRKSLKTIFVSSLRHRDMGMQISSQGSIKVRDMRSPQGFLFEHDDL